MLHTGFRHHARAARLQGAAPDRRRTRHHRRRLGAGGVRRGGRIHHREIRQRPAGAEFSPSRLRAISLLVSFRQRHAAGRHGTQHDPQPPEAGCRQPDPAREQGTRRPRLRPGRCADARGGISGGDRVHLGRHHDRLLAHHHALFHALRSRPLSQCRRLSRAHRRPPGLSPGDGKGRSREWRCS